MAGTPPARQVADNDTAAADTNGTHPSVEDLVKLIGGVNPSGRDTAIGEGVPRLSGLAKALIPGAGLFWHGGS
jgi:hypothetical protein